MTVAASAGSAYPSAVESLRLETGGLQVAIGERAEPFFGYLWAVSSNRVG